MAQDFPRIKDGDKIEPYHFNMIYDELTRLRKMKFRGPVSTTGMDSASGPPVVTIFPGASGQLAITSSSITARSGTTPGTGTVTPLEYNGNTMGNTGADDLTVYLYATGNGINSAAYCWIEMDSSGYWWIVSAEC